MCQLSEKHFSGEKKINSDQQMEKKNYNSQDNFVFMPETK